MFKEWHTWQEGLATEPVQGLGRTWKDVSDDTFMITTIESVHTWGYHLRHKGVV
jgi:hypothetical protein